MATIKSFTDLEQSKKLAGILPHESADFGWNVFVDGTSRILPINDWDLTKDGSNGVKFFHAWSLAALLNILPKHIGDYSKCLYYNNGRYYCGYMDDGDFMLTLEETKADNPVDACYEMALRLHKLKLL